MRKAFEVCSKLEYYMFPKYYFNNGDISYPQGVEKMVTMCYIKALHGQKVTGLKFHGKNSSHANGRCGPGWV